MNSQMKHAKESSPADETTLNDPLQGTTPATNVENRSATEGRQMAAWEEPSDFMTRA